MDSSPRITRSATSPDQGRVAGANGLARAREEAIPRAADPAPGRGGLALLAIAATAAFSFSCASPRAEAQDDVKNFKKPILVVETEGHHAPIRSLIWRNAFSLLSGGQDKVVKVWDFGDGARLSRTIRPMIWRGLNGAIYTMALSPKPDERGESFLAVAGYGILTHRGDITVYRYPGRNRDGTGEPVARLFGRGEKEPGHTNTVLCMAFDPSGKILASGGSDSTAILWERAGDGFRHRATLRGHAGAVKALAFTPDGGRLITAGGSRNDGSVRVWDVATGAQTGISSGTPPISEINTMALHPREDTLVVGREDGALLQLDLRNLAQSPVRLATQPGRGPIEHVSFSPDGTRLAVSLIANWAERLNPKALACDIEIREMPGGAVSHRHAGVPGLFYATAFSPDGSKLAYAGGHSQAIFIRDVRVPQGPPTELKGQGTTIMTVGFTGDSQAVAFGREADGQARPAGPAEGFDLQARIYRPIERDQIRGPILQHQGWTLRVNLRPYGVQAINADGRATSFAVNRLLEGNSWSHTIIPGNAERGHPRATVAVGTEAGVIVYDLETGNRTRMFAGHSAPITALAPSPDGRWLASGSVDQTIRIYPLSGCDTLPGLGATFQRQADSSWAIEKVEPRSFAARMGLLAGDRVLRVQMNDALNTDPTKIKDYVKAEEIAEFVGRAEAAIPNDRIRILVRRNLWIPGFGRQDVDLPGFNSTKQDNPALNLLVGLDKEWILWTPRGYYDTSIEGDSRLLGWQINPRFNPTLNEAPRPTDFLPIASFASKLIREDILDQVWKSAGVAVDVDVVAAAPPEKAAPLPEKIVAQEQPPRIEFASAVPGVALPAAGETWTVTAEKPRIKIQISAAEGSRVKDRQVVIDERLVAAGLDAPAGSIGEEFELPLSPDRPVRVSVKATNEADNPRSSWIDVVYKPPPPPKLPVPEPLPVQVPPPRRPRLIMVGIGIDEFQNPNLPRLEFASNDARNSAKFLSEHLVTPSETSEVKGRIDAPITLIGADASAKKIGETFDRLRDQIKKEEIVAGDMVAVFLESHVLEWGPAGKKTTIVAPADLGEGVPPTGPSISTGELSERLGELTRLGCRVVLFLDGVHLPTSGKGSLRSDVNSWVRELRDKFRVITFIASKYSPSQSASGTERQGLFALGLSRAFRGMPVGAKANKPISIKAFETAVVEEVRNLSTNFQEAGMYLPTSVPSRSLFAKP